MQVIVVTIFSIGYNIPRFFQYDIYYTCELLSAQKHLGACNTNNTELYHNASYVIIPKYKPNDQLGKPLNGSTSIFELIYTNVLYTVLVLCLPMILLGCTNKMINTYIIHLPKFTLLRCNDSHYVKSYTINSANTISGKGAM